MSDLSPEKFVASMNLSSGTTGVNQGGSRQSRIERRRDTSRIHITTFHLEEHPKFYNTLVDALFQLSIEGTGPSVNTSAPARSVLGQRRIDLLRPGQNAAGEVRNICESSLLHRQRGLLATYASFAVDNDFAVLLVCQLVGVTRKTIEIKAQTILRIDYNKAAVADPSDGAAPDDETSLFRGFSKGRRTTP
jgi:hypothetical protein